MYLLNLLINKFDGKQQTKTHIGVGYYQISMGKALVQSLRANGDTDVIPARVYKSIEYSHMNVDMLKEMMEVGGRYDITFEAGGVLISAYPIPDNYYYASVDTLIEILLEAGYKITPDDV